MKKFPLGNVVWGTPSVNLPNCSGGSKSQIPINFLPFVFSIYTRCELLAHAEIIFSLMSAYFMHFVENIF